MSFTDWTKYQLVDKPIDIDVIEYSNQYAHLSIKDIESKILILKKFDRLHITNNEPLIRRYNIALIQKRINEYDIIKKEIKPDYKTYDENYNKLDEKDENIIVDSALDIILRKKMDLCDEEPHVSTELLEELKKQELLEKQRLNEYKEKITKVKHSINEYDAKKKEDETEYISFESTCSKNEEDDLSPIYKEQVEIMNNYIE